MRTDFYGVPIDHSDQAQINTLIFIPLSDSLRTMHSLTCPHHGFEIDEDKSITLLAEEVRAISFIVPHWFSLVTELVQNKMPKELDDILDDMRPYANGNDDYKISVSDARILYPSICALETVVTLKYSMLNYMFGIQPGDDDI